MDSKSVQINGIEYRIHPRYKKYGCNDQGQIINIFTHKSPKQSIDRYGYIVLNIAGLFRWRTKIWKINFIYECYHGLLNKDDCILPMNCNIKDIRPSNLVCLS